MPLAGDGICNSADVVETESPEIHNADIAMEEGIITLCIGPSPTFVVRPTKLDLEWASDWDE